MKKSIDLLEGPIASSLAKLAFPIMLTSLIQMAYNLIDMIWIGRISSNAVAAVGAAGMYLWLANGVATMPRIGGQVKVAQSLGGDKLQMAVEYAKSAIQMGIIFGALFGLLCMLFSGPLIGFFKLNNSDVILDARYYLIITGGGVLFTFINQILTGILTAMGNSMVTFRATTVGLVINFFLDPVLIFGIGIFPRLEVAGAAIATLLAQAIVFVVFLATVWKEETIFKKIHVLQRTKLQFHKDIIKIGFPISIQSILFTGISMIIARLIAGWGDAAVAVQKVGSQIESISWMTAEGFASAVNAFIAQNYGANKKDRIKKGYFTAMTIMILWGIVTSFVLIVFPQVIFRIFITEADVLPMGVDYLRIIGVCQLFMCTEITSGGAFQGFGRTLPPSIVGIVFTSMRIPMAMVISSTVLGLNGIWWSISISSILKGTVLPVWFLIFLHRYLKSQKC